MKLEERIVHSVQLLGCGLDSRHGHKIFLQTIQTGCGAHQTFCLFNVLMCVCIRQVQSDNGYVPAYCIYVCV